MYAIIQTGGKQYRVTENQIIQIEKIPGKEGDHVQFAEVLAIESEKGINIGTPYLKDMKISAEILEQKKDKKILIFKKKRRHNYRRKKGHRQNLTTLRIMDVSGKGEIKKMPAKTKKTITPKQETKSAKPATPPAPQKKESKAAKPSATKNTPASQSKKKDNSKKGA